MDYGNAVVFSRKPSGSYIVNDSSGRRTPLAEEMGAFVMEVEYLEPDASAGFAGQGMSAVGCSVVAIRQVRRQQGVMATFGRR